MDTNTQDMQRILDVQKNHFIKEGAPSIELRVDRLNFDLPQVNLISFSPSSIIIKTSDPDGKRLIISKKVTAETDTSPDCKTSALILSEQ